VHPRNLDKFQLGHGTGFMNTGLNLDFSEFELDFQNQITKLSDLKKYSNLNSNPARVRP